MTDYQIIKDIITLVFIPVCAYLWACVQKQSTAMENLKNMHIREISQLREELLKSFVTRQDFNIFNEKIDKMNEAIVEIKIAVGIQNKDKKA